MKPAIFSILFFLMCSYFTACGQQTEVSTPSPTLKEKVELPSGLYLLNGTDPKYGVFRRNINEYYRLNPQILLKPSEADSIRVVEEDNGIYSIHLYLNKTSAATWNKAANDPDTYYIGFVANQKLWTVIQAKPVDNTKPIIHLKCLTENETEIKEILDELKMN